MRHRAAEIFRTRGLDGTLVFLAGGGGVFFEIRSVRSCHAADFVREIARRRFGVEEGACGAILHERPPFETIQELIARQCVDELPSGAGRTFRKHLHLFFNPHDDFFRRIVSGIFTIEHRMDLIFPIARIIFVRNHVSRDFAVIVIDLYLICRRIGRFYSVADLRLRDDDAIAWG